MSDQARVQIPLEVTVAQRDELDRVARLLGESRMTIIRTACREYVARVLEERAVRGEPAFFVPSVPTDGQDRSRIADEAA